MASSSRLADQFVSPPTRRENRQTLAALFRSAAVGSEEAKAELRLLGRGRAEQNAVRADAVIAMADGLDLIGRERAGQIFRIDDDVVAFRQLAPLVAGAAHPSPDHLVGVLRARVQALLQVGGGRRQDEDADDILARLLPQLLGTLPVDIEQHILSGRKRGFDRRARPAVALAEPIGPFP